MDNYTEYEKLNQMFNDEFLDLMIDKKVEISDELINYLYDFRDELEKFEEDITKILNSSNFNQKILEIKLEIYEKKAKKYIEEKSTEVNSNIKIIEKSSYSNLSLVEQDKKEKEIALITSTNINDIKIVNHQLNIFALDFPIFSLKLDKKQDEFLFKNSKDEEIMIKSENTGRATIQDSDLWLYCISKMMQSIYEKKIPTRKVNFTGYDFLKTTKRTINGANYQQLIKSLDRLSGTTMRVNKDIGFFEGGEKEALIIKYRYLLNKKNKKIAIEVTLPEWLYKEAVEEKKVLIINEKYYRLKPFEKRFYHLAKRSCFFDKKTNQWVRIPYSLDYFIKKIGSNSKLERFRYEIKKLVKKQEEKIKEIEEWESLGKVESEEDKKPILPLLEYILHYDVELDKVMFFHINENIALENKESIRKIEAKNKRENIEKTKIKRSPENIEKNLLEIKKSLEIFVGKNYPIFKTKILTDEKLKEYLRIFDVKYLIDKIRAFIDFDFIDEKGKPIINKEGYFYQSLQNGLNQNNLPF